MDIKNMLQKAGGLARQHSEKLPRQLRPAVKSAARFLGDRDEDHEPPSRTREQQAAAKEKPAGTKKTTPATPAKAEPATRTKSGSSRAR